MSLPPILLDISRTLARTRLPAPTGVDRVERAYIDWALPRGALFLAGAHVLDRAGFEVVERFIEELRPRWTSGHAGIERLQRQMRHGKVMRRVADQAIGTASDPEAMAELLARLFPGGGLYLNTGHDNLHATMIEAMGDAGLTRAVLLHDAIPYDYPQYTRPGTPERFRTKLEAAAHADLLIYNSAHTGERIAHHLGGGPAGIVAPLGLTPMARGRAPGHAPYFLTVGTIEPRKNHALLLDLWAGVHGPPPAAHLRIAGRRGWNNEAVFRRLDRDAIMGRTVFEDGAPVDAVLIDLIAGARAVLLPSFAEGYGLPLAEALALGTPVIASDLPALREVGGAVPDWLPVEGAEAPGLWLQAIRDHEGDRAPRRAAQLDRMARWQAPTWQAHFQIVENAVETILVQASPGG